MTDIAETTIDGEDIELGQMYVDTITGFQGIATAYIMYLNEPTLVKVETDSHEKWLSEDRVRKVSIDTDSQH